MKCRALAPKAFETTPAWSAAATPYHTAKAAVHQTLARVLEFIGDAVKSDEAPPLAQHFHKPPSPASSVASTLAMRKMWKNGKKAIEEHLQRNKEDPYATWPTGLPEIEALIAPQDVHPLQLSHASAAAQGPRPTMEDAHFFKEIPQGVIAGVLDGHGGKGVADYVSFAFQQQFADMLTQTNGDVYRAFSELTEKVQTEVVNHDALRHMGSTAVICFIDKASSLVYTATLGDSEANLYRHIQAARWVAIPLSCVRDWTSKRDARRAAVALDMPALAVLWPQHSTPKCLRFPGPFYGLNISRAFGDADYAGTPEKPGVSHKPKITVNRLLPGDVLILACDGLKDYVRESEIIQQIRTAAPGQNLAQALVDYAIHTKQAYDNVTVLAIKAKG